VRESTGSLTGGRESALKSRESAKRGYVTVLEAVKVCGSAEIVLVEIQ
jgi:hypothetical protein